MDLHLPGTTITPQLPNSDVTGSRHSSAPADEPSTNWQFKPEENTKTEEVSKNKQPQKTSVSEDKVAWTNTEFIKHEKSISWYGLLAIGALAAALLIYFLTHDKISAAVIIVAAIVLGFYAARKPRVLNYLLDDNGLTIGQKYYDYDLFKSFSVIDEGSNPSIVLMPLKRFMSQLTIYYEPKDEQKIVRALADRLPMDNRQADIVDRFMHRIRF